MLRQFGKIRSAHGIRGEVFLISFSKSFDWLENRKKARLLMKEKDEEGQWQTKSQEFKIKKNDRIAQLLIHRTFNIEWNEVHNLEDSNRSDGGFGHTGKQ